MQRPHGALRGRTRRNSRARSRSRGGPASGITHTGVRWNRCSDPTSRLDLGHDLDRRRAGADHRDPLAGEVVVVVPAAPSGTSCPRSARCPACSGSCGSVSPPMAPTRTFAVSSPWEVCEPPAPRASSSQRGAGDLVAEADVGDDAGSSRDPAQVLADLRLQRIQPAPVGVRREGERVERRGDVALAARDRCCRARCRRGRRRARARTKSSTPSSSSRIAIPMPEKPAPMIATRAWRAPPSPLTDAPGIAVLGGGQLGEQLLRLRRDLVVDLDLVALGLHRADRGEVATAALRGLGDRPEGGAEEQPGDQAVEQDPEEAGPSKNSPKRRPKRRPIIAPCPAPTSAARPVVSRPAICSTVFSPVPTIAARSTGNPRSERKSTARSASR